MRWCAETMGTKVRVVDPVECKIANKSPTQSSIIGEYGREVGQK